MIWLLAALVVAGFLALWLWLDHRLSQIDAMFKIIAHGVVKAKDDVIEEVWSRTSKDS